jgi:hypothetical protein
MRQYQAIVRYIVVFCLAATPVLAHAHSGSAHSRMQTNDVAQSEMVHMPDCPMMKKMTAGSLGMADHSVDQKEGSAGSSCYLKCYHSADVVESFQAVYFMPANYRIAHLSPPRSPEHRPPTPPPNGASFSLSLMS